MASSSSHSEDPSPPWLELPREITATILLKLGAVEILTTAQFVCRTWWRVCLDASMWRSISMRYERQDPGVDVPHNLMRMCRLAVNRSQGQLVDLNIEYFGSNDLLLYVAERCTQLKRLRLVSCDGISGLGLTRAVEKFPLLEELHLYYSRVHMESIEDIGFMCEHLKSFKLNNFVYKRPHIECDLDALAIAESMPELRHLQLIGSKLTNSGVQAILDGCPHLESLDLRQCLNVNLEGDLETLCSQKIKDLRRPNDPTDDYEFDANLYESSEGDYITGYSDIDLSDLDDYMEFSEGTMSPNSYNDDDSDDGDGDGLLY